MASTSAADAAAGVVAAAASAAAAAAALTTVAAAAAGDEDAFTRADCRMYEQPFPEIDSLVMVRVNRIEDMGAYVSLLEYGNREGMILLSELSRRRIRSVNRLIRVGRLEVAVVLRVDQEKGYIDLSKRRVSPEDSAKCEERYNKSKAVHSILRHVAESSEVPLLRIYEQFGWPLYRKFGHAYDAFTMAIHEPDSIFEGLDIDAPLRESILVNIRRRMTPTPVKLRTDVEVSCFHYEGVDAVRRALRAGEGLSTDVTPVKVSLIAPPLYVVTTVTLDRDAGIRVLNQAVAKIAEVIKAAKGTLVVKVEPRLVSEKDERMLTQLMDRMAFENREISGDSDEEDDAPEGM